MQNRWRLDRKAWSNYCLTLGICGTVAIAWLELNIIEEAYVSLGG